jgi:hypothetical protein
VSGSGPWWLGEEYGRTAAVISWETVLDALSKVSTEPLASDLTQFEALYVALTSNDIDAFPLSPPGATARRISQTLSIASRAF